MNEDRIWDLVKAAHDYLEDRRVTHNPLPYSFQEALQDIKGLEEGDKVREFAEFEAIIDQALELTFTTQGFKKYLKLKLWVGYHFGLPSFDVLFPLGVLYRHFGLFDEEEVVFLEHHYLNEAFRELFFDMAVSLGENLYLAMRGLAGTEGTIGAFVTGLAGEDDPNAWPPREKFWGRVWQDTGLWYEYMRRAELLLEWSTQYKAKYGDQNAYMQEQILQRFLNEYR